MANLSTGLADFYRVEIISLFHFANAPQYPIDPRVRLTYLEDVRRPGGRPAARSRPLRAQDDPKRSDEDRALDRQPSRFLSYSAPTSALTDRALERCLSRLQPGVLLSNRPMLHEPAATWLPKHTALIAVEHSAYSQRNAQILQLYRDNAPRFDAFVTVSEDDREAFHDELGQLTRVVAIPNAVPDPGKTVSTLSATVVVGAGALVRRKGFDRLIEAFAPLAADHPDWQLHIYGKGGERAALLDLVEQRGLADHVLLKGFDPDLQERLSEASVFALSSHAESFGMVIVEAMGTGVPVVAFDCPSGPRHLIHDGVDGLLVPNDDVPAFTDALRRFIEDESFRRSAGAAALRTAAEYDVDAVVSRWRTLFDEVRRSAT
jgi:glycosyltransferase involved in cell wall biosynthesis